MVESLRNRRSEPQRISPAGSRIVEWEYLDKDGKLKKQKRDVYSFIQSSEPLTRYKDIVLDTIEQGELSYVDTSGIADNDPETLRKFLHLQNARMAELQSMVDAQAQTSKVESPAQPIAGQSNETPGGNNLVGVGEGGE